MTDIGIHIDFSTFLRVVGHVIDEAKPIIIRGRHGIGKSELVYALAKQRNMPVVERRASQMTEGDLVGLPSVNGNRTSFNPPDWFKEACEKPVFLFLDEVDRATIEVRQGIFELTDSRKLNGHTLHPGTRIFAAVNGGKHAKQYQVGEMDPAELDRWTVFDVEPTVEDWLSWAKDKVHNVIWDFINQNHTHLEHKDDFEPNKKYPSRRSWKRASDTLSRAGVLEEHSMDVIPLANGFLGYEAAVSLNDFIKNYQKQVVPDDILKNGKFEMVKEFTINDHCALIDKMENSDSLKHVLDEKELHNFAQYFVMLPSEAAMKLFKVLGSGGKAENSVAFYRQEVDIPVLDENGNKTKKKEKIKIAKYMVRILAPASATQEKK